MSVTCADCGCMYDPGDQVCNCPPVMRKEFTALKADLATVAAYVIENHAALMPFQQLGENIHRIAEGK